MRWVTPARRPVPARPGGGRPRRQRRQGSRRPGRRRRRRGRSRRVPRARPHGLPAGGPAPEPGFVDGNLLALETVAAATGRCAAVVGFVDEDGDLYNAAAVCAGGKVHGVLRKELLPNYGVFDEQRWFRPGASRRTTPVPRQRGPCRRRRLRGRLEPDRAGRPARRRRGGAGRRAQRARPTVRASSAERERMLATRAADASCGARATSTSSAARTSSCSTAARWSSTTTASSVASAPQFREALLVVDLDIRPAYRKRILDPRGHEGMSAAAWLSSDAGPTGPPGRADDARASPADRLGRRARRARALAEVYEALVLGTRDYVREERFTDVLVGAFRRRRLVARRHDRGRRPRPRAGPRRPDAVALLVAGLVARRPRAGREPRHRRRSTVPIEAPAPRAAGHARARVENGRSAAGLAGENLQARIRGLILMAHLERAGLARAHDGQQERDGRRLRHLVRGHGRRLRRVQGRPEDTRLRALRAPQRPGGNRPRAPGGHREGRPRPSCGPTSATTRACRPTRSSTRSSRATSSRTSRSPSWSRRASMRPRCAASSTSSTTPSTSAVRRRPGPRVTSRGFGKDRRMPITNLYRASAGTGRLRPRPPAS